MATQTELQLKQNVVVEVLEAQARVHGAIELLQSAQRTAHEVNTDVEKMIGVHLDRLADTVLALEKITRSITA
jgi:hypothetical protein